MNLICIECYLNKDERKRKIYIIISTHANNLMKLPAFFDKKVAKVEGNKGKEKGKIRSKEHIHGNWPTIIYIPSNMKNVVLKFNNCSKFKG
jgi:hypothetical protein